MSFKQIFSNFRNIFILLLMAFSTSYADDSSQAQNQMQDAENYYLLRSNTYSKIDTRFIVVDDKNRFIGTVTRVHTGIFIGSAHVLENLNDNSFAALLKKLNINSEKSALYQFKYKEKFLDAVVIVNSGLVPQETLQAEILKLTAAQPKTGDLFVLDHVTELDGVLVEQKSTGTLSISQDKNLIYLNNSNTSHLTWGSSGSVVFSGQQFIGLIQCVVQNEIASGFGRQLVSYFRAISSNLLRSSELIAIKLSDLNDRKRRKSYMLKSCDPVDAKRGGGG